MACTKKVATGELALAVGLLRATAREGRERAGGAQERAPCVQVLALAPVPGLGLDSVEECLGDDAGHGYAAAPRARAGGAEEGYLLEGHGRQGRRRLLRG